MKRNSRRRADLEAKSSAAVADTASNQQPERTAKRKRTKKVKADAIGDETSPYFQNVPPTQTAVFQPGERLTKSFYSQDTISLSKALLGKVLCRKLPGTGQVVKGTIVETEAYPGVGDAASRSCKGVPTPASVAMFMDAGTAFVYFTYGMYYCYNITSQDNGGAALLRAVEVLEDYDIMHTLRQAKKKQSEDKPAKRIKQHELANGPAKLCLAFDINRDSCDKTDMTISEDLWLEESLDPKYHLRQFEVKESRRVGIDNTPPEARYKLYRYFVDDNTSVGKVKFKDIPPPSKTKKSKSKK